MHIYIYRYMSRNNCFIKYIHIYIKVCICIYGIYCKQVSANRASPSPNRSQSDCFGPNNKWRLQGSSSATPPPTSLLLHRKRRTCHPCPVALGCGLGR